MKRTVKRIAFVCMALALCFCLCSCSLSIEGVLNKIKNYVNGEEGEVIPPDFVESRENEVFTYDVYLTYVVLTGYLGEPVNVTVPASIDGLPVTRIGSLAFYSGAKVESVVLPEGVKELGENAFYYCKALKTVSLPSTVEKIGDKCFSWCESLTSVSLPAAVTAIPDFCFNQCKALKKVTFAGRIRSVGARAFSECVSLGKLEFTEELRSVGAYAFRGDAELVFVRLSGNCNLGASAFEGCSEAFTVVAPAGSATMLTCEQLGVNVSDVAPEYEEPDPETSGETSGDASGDPIIDLE